MPGFDKMEIWNNLAREALIIFNKAVACIESKSEYFIYDSQVRISL